MTNRDWGDNKKLDLAGNQDAYDTWQDRALGHLAKDRPDVRRLLLWAERRSAPITAVEEAAGARECGVGGEVASISYTLFEAIKFILHDSMLSRARTCDERGLELWRKLRSEWMGSSGLVVAAKMKRYIEPVRCSTAAQLWEALPSWEQLGEEVIMGGLTLDEPLRALALDRLIPDDMLKIAVGRPELTTYSAKLTWVRAQMEHAKSAARATHFAAAAGRGKREETAMDVGNMMHADVASEASNAAGRSPPLGNDVLAHMTQAITSTLHAVMKGKGKGKGSAMGGRPAGPPGAASPKGFGGKGSSQKGQGPVKFDGTCNHCGKYGHRKSECRALDAEMARLRGTGGKGLHNMDGEDTVEQPGESETAEHGEQQGEGGDLWWMGAAYSLTRESTTTTRAPRKPVLADVLRLQNRFETLQEEEAEEDTEEMQVGVREVHGGGRDELKMAGGDASGSPPPPPPRDHAGALLLRTTFRGTESGRGRRPLCAQHAHPGARGGHHRRTRPEGELPHACCCPGRGSARMPLCRHEGSGQALCYLGQEVRSGERGEQEHGMQLNALGKPSKGAKLVEAVIDSGAVDSVAPPGVFASGVRPSAMSRAGKRYRGPDGSAIPNLGQADVRFTTDEGHRCVMTLQVAEIDRPLIAVTHLSACGNRVILGKDGGVIEHERTGRKIKIHRKGGVYVMRMWVPAATSAKEESTKATASGFPRPGRV